MKKILKTNWERYKNSSEGQEVIGLFNYMTTPECTPEEMLTIVKRFNPVFAKNTTAKEDALNREAIAYYNKVIKENVPNNEGDRKDFNYVDFFERLTHCMAVEDENTDLFDAPQIGFKRIIGCNVFLSVALSANMPEYFIPNLFAMQFVYFKKFAEKYELDIPDMPLRSDYRSRWLYYIHMCNAIDTFAVDNEIQDFGELCSFLFDYELTNIKEEITHTTNYPLHHYQ